LQIPNTGANVRRRELIRLIVGATTLAPIAARGQQPSIPIVGYLHTRGAGDAPHLAAAFRRGLRDGGFVEGRDVKIEFRWASGDYDRLPALAQELVNLPVAVLAAAGGEPAVMAAKGATSTIPIVFSVSSDVIKLGLAASYNRPGGNATGINILTTTL
jgi:putative ABC transport system substrate-binding protein